MAASWRSANHPRGKSSPGTNRGSFVRKLMSARVGTALRTEHGVSIRSGVQRQGRRRRRLFSVEGGGVHRDANAAVAEAHEIGAPVTTGDRTGPKSYTGWLGRYRRMTEFQLEEEWTFLDTAGQDPEHVDPATRDMRVKALDSALREARGEKTIQKRPGARKDDSSANPRPKVTGKYSASVEEKAEALRVKLDKVKRFAAAEKTNRELGEAVWDLAGQIAGDRRREINVDNRERHELIREKQDLWMRIGQEGVAEKLAAIEVKLKPLQEAAKAKQTHKTEREWEEELTAVRNKRQKAMDLIVENGGRVIRTYGAGKVKVRDYNNTVPPDLIKEFDKLHKESEKIWRASAIAKKQAAERRGAAMDYRPDAEALREALALVRPGFGEGKLKIHAASGGRGVKDLFDIAATYLPKEWVDGINGKTSYVYGTGKSRPLKIRVKGRARAHYNSYEHEILMAKDSESYSTALHELGHAVEATRSEIRDMERIYYDNRTRGGSKRLRDLQLEANAISNTSGQDLVSELGDVEGMAEYHRLTKRRAEIQDQILKEQTRLGERYTKRRLRDITKSKGYEDHEVAIEDEFVTPYMGKDYGGSFYELLTMGLEGVFFNNKGMSSKDPDMRTWILGILAAL